METSTTPSGDPSSAHSSTPVQERKIEPLFDTSKYDPFVLSPVPKELEFVQQHYETQRSLFWTEDEIDFSQDYGSWVTLDDKLQHLLINTFAFFANADAIIFKGLDDKFLPRIAPPIVQIAIKWQATMEGIHQVTYTRIIETIIRNESERIEILKSIETNPIVKPKAEWAIKWLSEDCSLGTFILAWCCVEGIFFSSSFATLKFLAQPSKDKKILPGACAANEFILRDESLHVRLEADIFKYLIQDKPKSETIYAMVDSAVKIEQKFVEDCLPEPIKGMNQTLMKEYVEHVGDTILGLLGLKSVYNTKNPFEWMNRVNLPAKANFFEKRVTEYARPSGELETLSGLSYDDLDI
jgi:ribonucleotide reductase beta subunit family protein with ferritin-like domain